MKWLARWLGSLLIAPMAIAILAPSADVMARQHDHSAAKPHPEARPFDENADAAAQVDAALARARGNGRRSLIIFGANWCHDSRSLAGELATDRFKTLLATRYELVFVDVGLKDRNFDLAQRFGLNGIEGTPTMLILSPDGTPLNLDDAPRWRNTSSRSADEIYEALAETSGAG